MKFVTYNLNNHNHWEISKAAIRIIEATARKLWRLSSFVPLRKGGIRLTAELFMLRVRRSLYSDLITRFGRKFVQIFVYEISFMTADNP